MLIITCTPVPGFKVYRCGFREEIREGRTVRVGLSWPAGETRLPDDALTPEQIDALKRDPGKRVSLTHVPDALPVDGPPVRTTVESTLLEASSAPPSATPAPPRPLVDPSPLEASSAPPSATSGHSRPTNEPTSLDASSPPPGASPVHRAPNIEPTPLDASSVPPGASPYLLRSHVQGPPRRNQQTTAPLAMARGPPTR
ncbi:hypothetical protein [Polyangium fumosum]|uniref:Uncharacterized protein n=1 Tax=Polyangium fumosum TaxID=889272 RepID=A0A4U1I8Q5_9BACT|nr:hypothetical protein [Polyangium fumosum]TKC89839.1 hypothetical protein E8A74_51290 [Polyangium fumosum]